MIKQIPVERLKPGMYIHDLDVAWVDHPFLRNQFPVLGEEDVRRVVEAGIRRVYIDTDKGDDVPEAPSAAAVHEEARRRIEVIGDVPTRIDTRGTLAEELPRARRVRARAEKLMRQVLSDARMGKAIDTASVDATVADITDTLARNPGALLSLVRIKEKDGYTFLHSVSVCALLVAFGRSQELDAETVRQLGIGGLLHDLGKMRVPDAVLNKPGRLSEEEFERVKRHSEDGLRMIEATPGIGPIPGQIAHQHHERSDGSGYPRGLAGEDISPLARMAAVVDVYDAITSDRCYHRGIPPTEALRQLYQWSDFHFDRHYVQAFMRCVGIYPVGTLVRLESGRLGVVLRQNEQSLVRPVVRAFFSSRDNCHIPPVEVDLSRALGHGGGDRIVGHESPDAWGVDPGHFL